MCDMAEVATTPIGGRAFSERALLLKIERLKADLKKWAMKNDLWFEECFRTPFRHRGLRPRPCEVLYLISEGALAQLGLGGDCDGYECQFLALLKRHGFIYEMVNHYTFVFYPEDESLQQDYLVLDRWRWVQDLAKKRLFDVHSEVFAHFAHRPDDLKKLTWRQYEEFLDAVFRNQGFRTELGPGQGDGGVDIRLYQSGAIPELVTLVQAKRYRNRPIGLEAVAALMAFAKVENAPCGILATTSRFLPGAEEFARTTQRRLDLPSINLATSSKVGGWCAEIAQHLDAFFTNGRGATPCAIVAQPTTKLTGRVVIAHSGYNCVRNDFAMIEADFPHEVILRRIGSRQMKPGEQSGMELADETVGVQYRGDIRFVAFKKHRRDLDSRLSFWGDDQLYALWDGTPQGYDWCD